MPARAINGEVGSLQDPSVKDVGYQSQQDHASKPEVFKRSSKAHSNSQTEMDFESKTPDAS